MYVCMYVCLYTSVALYLYIYILYTRTMMDDRVFVDDSEFDDGYL